MLHAFYSQGSHFCNALSCDSAILFDATIYCQSIQNALKDGNIHTDETTLACQKIAYNGTKYEVGQVLLLNKVTEDDSYCGEIILIIVNHGNDVIFVVYKRKISLLTDVGLFEIGQNIPLTTCINYIHLAEVQPLEIYQSRFVVLKHGY